MYWIQELEDHWYQAILVGPEMCLEHEGFRQLLKSPGFTKPLVSIVIDEAHCITQWGGEFRMTYDKLADLRSYIPMDIPFLATSAMLAPAAVQQVQAKLQINPQRSYIINLGNDCPNITPSVVKMKIKQDYPALLPLVALGISSHKDLAKTIIFTNSIQQTHEIVQFLQQNLSDDCRPYVRNYHALQSTCSKHRVMEAFHTGNVKILVATEAAGMVCTTLLHVISSLSNIWCRALTYLMSYLWYSLESHPLWRCGPNGRAMLVDSHIFKHGLFSWLNNPCFSIVSQLRKKTKRGPYPGDEDPRSSSSSSDKSNSEGEGRKTEWAKSVDPHLREWIETDGCWHDITDKYFGNTKERKGEITILIVTDKQELTAFPSTIGQLLWSLWGCKEFANWATSSHTNMCPC